ncbi:MAG: contractile injection system tape measure protein [Bacteroidales bacterium]|nr:contractile injection system tape measure protein [Bacteroidales bacterium]
MSEDLVNKLSFNLVFSDETSSESALDISNQYYRSYIQPSLEDVVKRYNHYDIRIENLDLDLGIVAPEDIAYKFSTMLENEIRKYISNKFDHEAVASQKGTQIFSNLQGVFSDNKSDNEKDVIINKNISGGLLSDEDIPRQDAFPVFVAYIADAAVPWYYSSEKKFKIARISTLALSDICSDKYRFDKLIQTISSNRYAFSRFTYLVTEAVLRDILLKFIEDNANTIVLKEITDAIYTYYNKTVIHTQSSTIRKQFLSYFGECLLFKDCRYFDPIYKELHSQSVTNYITQESDSQSPRSATGSATMSAEVDKSLKIRSGLDHGSSSGEKEESYLLSDKSQETAMNNRLKKVVKDRDKKLLQHLLQKYKSEDGLMQNSNYAMSDETEELKRILVFNAGLVLLVPMLPTCFDRLGYLDESGKFWSMKHRLRAVHILQLLAGDHSLAYDHLINLNKIICGIDVNFPVNPVFRMRKQEKVEVENLLKAVIKFWKILDDISIESLQETFIQRRGYVEKTEKDWIVRVESKTIDILLEDMPWGFNLLSLSWNDYLIYVEWNHNSF